MKTLLLLPVLALSLLSGCAKHEHHDVYTPSGYYHHGGKNDPIQATPRRIYTIEKNM